MATTEPEVDLDYRALLWRWIRRPGWSVIAPVLLIVFAVVFAWQIFFSQSELDKGIAALSAAYRKGRPLETRISGFGYAPWGIEAGEVDEYRMKSAEDLLFRQTNHLNTAAALHARGKFYLAQRDFARAIQHLESAIKLDTSNTELHSDLGVAWMERAGLGNSQYLPESRTHLDQALQFDQRNLAALFNLALLDFRQGLWKAAEERWQVYLKNDERSAWAAEAKAYLNRIKSLKEQSNNSIV